MKHRLNQSGSYIFPLIAALALILIVVVVLLRVVNNSNNSTSSQKQSISSGPVTFEKSSSCTNTTQTVVKDGLTVTTNIDYMNVSLGGLCMDVYRQPGTDSRPAVALLHGSVNSPQVGLAGRGSLDSEAIQLANSGFIAVNVDWPPQVPYRITTAVQAVDNALSYIESHSSTYDIKPDSIGLLGTSGGGLLAGYVATQNISYLKSVVTWSGVFEPNDPNVTNDPRLGIRALNNWFGCTSASNCPQLAQYSTVNRVSSSTPPFALFNSTNELIPISQPDAMKAALSAAGVHNELTIYPGTRHATAYESDAMSPTIQWFQKYLN